MAEIPANLEECIHLTSSLICSIDDMDKLIMYTDRGCYDCNGFDKECNYYLNSKDLYKFMANELIQ